MHPVERLRSVSRWAVDDDALASEAAEALAAFSFDPAGLVVSCRRLLAHHVGNGPLWWLCSRVLAAPDPAEACREVIARLDADRTADRIAASLPLQSSDDEIIAVVGWPRAVDRALAERGDLAAVAVRADRGDLTAALRHRLAPRSVRMVDAWMLPDLAVSHLLVGACAIGAGRALVPAGTAETIAIARPEVGTWLIGGVGRVLPRRLFEAAEAGALAPHVDADDVVENVGIEAITLEHFDRMAGPRGLVPSAEADAHPDAPVAPELLRPL
ncbi:MAG: hypothetical protein QOH10_1378 [Actinomycetota bacterium]|nr:hypothetical protein [Actinomycetota bacterium]